MGVVDRKRTLFERVVRLRRAERRHPADEDIAKVRAELERELGSIVSVSLAAKLLGVSHTTVRRWVLAGDVATVMDRSGRTGVPVQGLLVLHEQVTRERSSGRRSLHVLEAVVAESRRRAAELDVRALVDLKDAAPRDHEGRVDPHERARLRSLAYHRALAPRLRRPMVDQALRRVSEWRDDGRMDPEYAQRWAAVLAGPVAEVRQVLEEDSARCADLRQNSPFGGMLGEAERRRILQEIC